MHPDSRGSTRRRAALVALALLASFTVGVHSADPPGEYTREVLSGVRTIDRVYRSMEGPMDTQHFSLGGDAAADADAELLWLTGARIEILDGEGRPASAEYLCHSNLYFEPKDYFAHLERFGKKVTPDQKFVDMNQGQLELRFPPEFGFPLLSDEGMFFHSMVINPVYDGVPFDVRVRTTFRYRRDAELERPMRPLSQRAVALRIPVGNYDEEQRPTANPKTCAPDQLTHADHGGASHEHGADADDHSGHEHLADSATEKVFTLDDEGPVYSIHWIVPPGRHEYREVVHEGLRIPYTTTTVHVVTHHLHPYGESLELRDVTADVSLFKARARNYDDRVGLAEVDYYSSREGFEVHNDHEYELIAVYDNPTDEPVDAMALVYLYFLDKVFDKREIDFSPRVGSARP